ncbi:hypothetical protein [Pseudogemmobacter bohemicus]|uniref:hypothetical protein n=1 Tax=Pseudogemmobacter bohemicus TaxID=2250708 RepID=UPI000DD41CA7|nr:hypothetical protein [Pseudogemmobacter bohemicus]
MIRILAAVALLAALAAGVQSWRLDLARDRAEAAEAKVSAYAEAARMRADQDRRQEALRREAVALDQELSTMEGADGALSDYLRDAARRLWP